MKKNNLAAVLGFAGLAAFSGCWGEFEEAGKRKGFNFDENTFTAEWNAWKNQNIKNYSFTLSGELPYWDFPEQNASRAILMYDYTVDITVKNGEMDSFEYIGRTPFEYDGNPPLGEDEASPLPPEYTSISDAYQKIYDRAHEEKEWWNNYSSNGHIISTSFEMKYNPQLHYITFFEPVSTWQPNTMVDTTAHAITISRFKIFDDNK